MRWMHVESGALIAIAYDDTGRRLRVRFTDGSTYEYRDVPPDAYATLMSAPSKGQCFNLAIRSKFSHRVVQSE